MNTLHSVCVYCGSATGADPEFAEAADALGKALAASGLALVYGGGSIGLMGRVARATMAAGGRVTGVIPRFLHDREVMLQEVTELVVTADMHERKRIMFERADGFVALPGGIGTLEELVEMMTWSQLGQHDKPIVLANVRNFWAPFNELLEHMRGQGFIHAGAGVAYDIVDNVADVVPTLTARHSELARDRHPSEEVLRRM